VNHSGLHRATLDYYLRRLGVVPQGGHHLADEGGQRHGMGIGPMAPPQVRLHVGRDQFDYFGRCLSLPAMFSSKIRLISATVAGFAIKLWPAGTIFSDSAPSKWELS
jgi:hypothetical protein